jgi:outer membrane protein assembly factor BamD (BamD/ComL family)
VTHQAETRELPAVSAEDNGRGRQRTFAGKPAGSGRSPDSEVHPEDVWSHTPPEHRRRVIAFLLIDVVLFAALGCFTYWLRTGDLYPLLRPVAGLIGAEPTPPRCPYRVFWKSCFKLYGPGQVSLSDFMIFPISVEHVPAHMLIVGLLVASLATIPILVAILYGFTAATVFLVIVGFVAVLPWLAIALLASCLIATTRPFRFSFRYATVLLALLPVVIYFFASSRCTVMSSVSLAGPIERMKLYVPWVVALMASCAASGIVLAIAYLINYRAGGIAPLLAVLFAVPVILFVTEVGADEMAYRLLEYDYGPSSSRVFDDLDTKELIERAAEREWITTAQKDEREIKAIIQNKLLLLKLALPTELARQQDEVVGRCDDFIARYPASRYVSNCLYLRGRALDMRIDLELLRRQAVLQFYSDFPCETSRETWQRLLREDPESPFASIAGLKLALLDAREGELKLAQDLLQRVERFGKPAATMRKTLSLSGIRQLLAPKPASSTLNVNPHEVAEEAAQVLSLIRENQDGPPRDAVHPESSPVCLLLRCDPRDRSYPGNLLRIDRLFPNSRLHDNLMVRLALTEEDPSVRRAKLLECTERYRSGDAAPYAIYELGLLEIEQNRRAEGREALEQLVKRYPSSPWAASAQRKLVTIEVPAKVK